MTKTTFPIPVITLAAFVSALLFANLAFADAVLTELSGEVEVGRGEPASWSPARLGDTVASNDRVRTGTDGRVEIKMDAGTLRVHENSMLRLPPPIKNADQVELEQGRSLFDVLRRGGRRFEVHTPTVVVSVKGTRFGVDAGVDIGEVSVYRGTVGVRPVGASDLLETLVREGFLATGGDGVPVQLEVSAASDPWQRWREFDRAELKVRQAPQRMGEMERAKAMLHRRTAADVIVKAAERRPEIAERLEKLKAAQQETSQQEEKKSDETRPKPMEAMPASPDPSGRIPSAGKGKKLQRQLRNDVRMMRTEGARDQARKAKQIIDSTRADEALEMQESGSLGGMPSAQSFANPGGNVVFNFSAVYELSPMTLLRVRESLMDLQTHIEDGSFVPTSPADLLGELSNELIRMGMTPGEALTAIQTLIGN